MTPTLHLTHKRN